MASERVDGQGGHMKPILLIHGYSSEGKNTRVEDIYGTLPAELRKAFGAANEFF